ncbi:MAG: hypothetical protein WCQ96_00890 [Patescibacteria group bacterium]
MKNQKSAERFVDDIIKDLPLSQYTPRFREELLEHLEDGGKDLTDRNENNISEKIMQKIGDKDTLTESYVDFYNRYCGNLWFLEFLIYMPLSILAFIMTSGSIFICTHSATVWYMEGFNLILSVIISFGIDYAFFKIVFWRLAPHIKNKRDKTVTVIFLTLVPTLYSVLALTSMTAGSIFLWDNFRDFSMPLSAISIYYLAICIAFKIFTPRRRKIFSIPLSPYLLLAGFWLILAASIFASYQKIETSDGIWQVIGAALLPLSLTTDVCLNLILGNLLSLTFSPATTCLIIGSLILVILLAGIYLFVSSKKDTATRHRQWRSVFAMTLISYSLYLLLPLYKISEPKIDWTVPVSKISENIERDELGLFYHLSKYINQDEGFAFHYQACADGNVFTIVQSSEKVFLLETDTAKTSDAIPQAVFKENVGSGKISCDQDHNGDFANGFTCLDKNGKPYADYIGSAPSSFCEKLDYNGKEIFANSSLGSFGSLNNIVITGNKEWAIIEIESGFYATEEIYLVDLRGLK